MSGLQDLNVEKAAQAVSERYAPKLERLESDETIRTENTHIMIEFTKIAIQLIQEDPTVTVEGQAPLTVDKALAKKITMFFAEGLFMALVMCKSKTIAGDVRVYLLQQLAMDLFAQSKSLAVAEGMDKESAKQLLKQHIGNALKAHVQEYEKANGPIPGRKVKVRS